MRKEYYNYVVKLPVLLHELFRGKVADYHFSDMTVVMNHLVKSYIRMTDGGRVSTATRRILLCMDRIPDMSFFFRRQEKSVLFFEMDPAVAGSLQRAIIAGGWGNRQRLVVRLVCAFCCGAGVTLNNLSMELASEEVFRRPEGYLIHTGRLLTVLSCTGHWDGSSSIRDIPPVSFGTVICFPSCVATITIPSTGSWLKCSVFPNAASPGRPERWDWKRTKVL